jgi:hypothetical protein
VLLGNVQDRDYTVGEFMKRLFCRPYGTDPDVYISLIPAVNYWAIINNPYGIKNA